MFGKHTAWAMGCVCEFCWLLLFAHAAKANETAAFLGH